MADGRKNDADKLALDLLPPDALEAVGRVLTYGAQKYEPRNWENGMRWGRVYAAVLRHLFAWWRGEEKDQESGLSHLSHAACGVLFLLAYSLRSLRDPHLGVGEPVGSDDRPTNMYSQATVASDGQEYLKRFGVLTPRTVISRHSFEDPCGA